jgi:hypothetical protein
VGIATVTMVVGRLIERAGGRIAFVRGGVCDGSRWAGGSRRSRGRSRVGRRGTVYISLNGIRSTVSIANKKPDAFSHKI